MRYLHNHQPDNYTSSLRYGWERLEVGDTLEIVGPALADNVYESLRRFSKKHGCDFDVTLLKPQHFVVKRVS
jgi:hypothetical protein